MKKRIGKIIVLSSALFTGASAYATPSAFVSKFGSLFIENHTTSTLLRDTEKSQTVWVLPPNSGETEFKGLVPSANLGFCGGLSNLMRASNSLDARIGRLAQKQEDLMPELIEVEKELHEALRAKGEVAQDSVIKDLLLLQNDIATSEERQEITLDKIETCEDTCEILLETYSEVSAHLKDQRKFLRQMQRDNRQATRKLRKAEAAVAAAEAVHETVRERYDSLLEKLSKLSNQIFEMYSSKGKLEGGTALVDYDTGWTQNVQSLERRYSQYDFKAIPTANARINANIIGASSKESYYESLPAVLDYTIDGMKYVPWGEVKHERSSLPAVLTGNIRLSTIGACPIAVQNFFKDTGFEPVRGALTTPKFAISATYDYPVAYNFKVTAKYNLNKFYEIIKKSGTRGGFFSSKSYSEVAEKKLDKDTFSINWEVEDPDSEYDFKRRSQIRAEIKKDLTNRVLNTMAQPAVAGQSSATFIDPGVPPEAGAIVAAKGLSKTCSWNMYCQAGSWVLRGLHAVFGSTSIEQTFKTTWDRTSEEIWSSEISKYRSASTSFGRK